MVEGDGCHRVAANHRRSLVKRRFTATSPNGKFRAGARAIERAGGVLRRIEVHGKNLFYFFGRKTGEANLVVHIHFGMAGAFAAYKGEEPPTTPNTRLRLVAADGPKVTAHLSAMIVVHGKPLALYAPLAAKLGPDPLRENADPTRFLECCAVAKKPIGAMMMDQACMAGVGNIYRTETLFEAGIHPLQPANTLTRQEMLRLWGIVTKQMQAGFKTGSIWGGKRGASCYGLERSARGGKVSRWEMAGRTVYACSVAQQLEQRSQPVVAAVKLVRTGTAHLGEVTAQVSVEARKRRTGEGLGVQHMALKDDATLSAALKAAQGKAKGNAKAKGKAKGEAKAKAEAAAPRRGAAAAKRPAAAPRFATAQLGGAPPPAKRRRAA